LRRYNAAKGGMTPLWAAAQSGHAVVVAALAAAGAWVDHVADVGAFVTPLFIAAQKGHAAAVTSLLAAGAEVDKVGWSLRTSTRPTLNLQISSFSSPTPASV